MPRRWGALDEASIKIWNCDHDFFMFTAIAKAVKNFKGGLSRNTRRYGSDPNPKEFLDFLAAIALTLLLSDRSCPASDPQPRSGGDLGGCPADQARHFGFAGVCVSSRLAAVARDSDSGVNHQGET